MIVNVFHKTMSMIALLGLLFNPASLAAEFLHPIPTTPYDSRLSMAGVFEPIPTTVLVRSAESMNSLFAQARSFRYVPDGVIDRWQSPAETEARRSGDCEDKALWLFDRLRRAGYNDVFLVVGRKSVRDRGLHVWVEIQNANGSRKLLDPAAAHRIWNTGDFDSHTYRPLYSFDGVKRYIYSPQS